MQENLSLVQLIVDTPTGAVYRNLFIDSVVENSVPLLHARFGIGEESLKRMVRFCAGGSLMVILDWYRQGMQSEPEVLAAQVQKLCNSVFQFVKEAGV